MSRQPGVRNELEGATDLLYTLDLLEEMVSNGKRVPMSRKVMVEEDEFRELLADIRANIPLEIRRAQGVVKERERIMGEAQEEALRVVNDAQERAHLLVSEHTVLAEAKQRGEEILKRAEKDAKEATGRAELYIINHLQDAQNALVNFMSHVEGTVVNALDELGSTERRLTGESDPDDR